MSTTKQTGRGHYPRKSKTYIVPSVDCIDESETLLRFGYSATTVCPSSSKKVVCQCHKCGQLLERIRIRVRPPVLCHSCVKSKVDYGPINGLVDLEATLSQMHYDVKTLPRYSLQKVVGICTTCQKRYRVRLASVRQGQQCRPCLRTQICNTQWSPRDANGHMWLNEEETLKQLNYSALTLSPKSNSMVIANCSCGKIYPRIRRNIHDNSVCVSCARRKINHEELQIKRGRTIKKHYPEGIPQCNSYGGTAAALGDYLSKILGRLLTRELLLSNGQRLDLFDPKTNIGIEYCGLYWHNEHSLTPRKKYYHADKMRAAQKDGYRLITVFEDEYLTHEKAIKNRLRVILGDTRIVLQARKGTIIALNADRARKFVEEHHIQGCPPVFKYAFGIEYEEELLGVVLGGIHHRQGHDRSLILSRLCFAPQVHITGGAKRLFKRLCIQGKTDNFLKIVTWADMRWTDGAVYSRLGMTLAANLPPDYSYIKTANPGKRYSKQSQQKRLTGCPPGVTEREWAHQNGFSRIWDCGHQRWEYDLLL